MKGHGLRPHSRAALRIGTQWSDIHRQPKTTLRTRDGHPTHLQPSSASDSTSTQSLSFEQATEVEGTTSTLQSQPEPDFCDDDEDIDEDSDESVYHDGFEEDNDDYIVNNENTCDDDADDFGDEVNLRTSSTMTTLVMEIATSTPMKLPNGPTTFPSCHDK